jgi:DNA (cytosine-5)-methyltransferase 1
VLENVTRAPLLDPLYLCGSSFNLPVLRHRAFETSWPVLVGVPWCGLSPHAQVPHYRYGRRTYPYARHSWRANWAAHVLPEVWPWLTLREAGQAIPPAYAQFLGRAFVRWTRAAAARPIL